MAGAIMQTRTSFFEAMFDFSFSEFVTARIIPIVYGILIFAAFLGAVGAATTVSQATNFLVALIVFPVVLLLGILAARIYTEMIMVMFKIAEHTRDTARNTAAARAEPAAC
jgi:ABC-type transport system involved in cytochrome c biogenesis permease component